MINIVLFGKPGAGKGTQAEFLNSKYQLFHISTGDLFRHHISNKTDLGMLAQSYINKGDLVPDQVTIDMLKEAVGQNAEAKGFIFDGFPRTTQQAKALDEFLSEKSISISATLALVADDDILIDRLIKRGKTSGRADDQDEEKIRKRFDEYNNKTAPLRAFYEAQGKFYSVDGIGEIEQITQRLTALIDGLLIK
ncbi:MAG: adenylate kinase [Flavobacteriaceae bacterium]|nr:adenylate kinase [Flavobacteriaceae bacterium]